MLIIRVLSQTSPIVSCATAMTASASQWPELAIAAHIGERSPGSNRSS
jgi:hypothetical protein